MKKIIITTLLGENIIIILYDLYKELSKFYINEISEIVDLQLVIISSNNLYNLIEYFKYIVSIRKYEETVEPSRTELKLSY